MKGEPLSSVLEQAVETPMVGKSVITLDDLSIRQIQELLHKAQYIDSHRKEVAHTCDGRVLATLFYEPSTRTRLSFETAMLRLGGKVIGFAGAQLASVTKGETISDTLKTVSNYVDVVAIRHPKEGAALVASRAASVPVINAGDGGHMHPHTDLGRFGDAAVTLRSREQSDRRSVRRSYLRSYRTLPDRNPVPFRQCELRVGQPGRAQDPTVRARPYQRHRLLLLHGSQGSRFRNRRSRRAVHDPRAEGTILQRRRLSATARHLHSRRSQDGLRQKRHGCAHPLPRVNEIAVEVDDDPRAAYFEQVKNGMLMRMALESSVVGDELPGYEPLESKEVAA